MSDIIAGALTRIDTRTQRIEAAIAPIVQGLIAVDSKVQAIDHQVDSLAQKQGETRQFLATFYEEFHGYLDDFRRKTELQLAETRLVKVRQEIERRFGHYDEVRRQVTGILQAADLAIVRAETVRTTAEELMLGAPRYWLAPGLVALMGWIVGERDIAERALAEAQRRDAFKTCLFFTLLCRRTGRAEAMSRWLEVYLRMIDPQAVDREVVVVFDAVATGILGRAAQEIFWQASLGWIAAMGRVPGHVESQARRWIEVLDAERGRVAPQEFVQLRAHSPAWPALAASLSSVRRNPLAAAKFRAVVEAPIILPPTVLAAVDGLLDTMVSRFDDEELPLRSQERLLQLILDEAGDRPAAEAIMAVQQEALEDKVSFVGRLTDILMYPQQAGASLAAQRYAAAFTRDWILAAHRVLVRQDSEAVPQEVDLQIGGWHGTSRDGHNGQELAASLGSVFAARKAKDQALVKLSAWIWVSLVAGLLFALGALTGGASFVYALFFLAIGVAPFLFGRRNRERRRQAIAAAIDAESTSARQLLDAVLADLASYRRNWTLAHTAAHDVEQVLRSISPETTRCQVAPDEPVACLAPTAGDGAQVSAGGSAGVALAQQCAPWDLIPLPVPVHDAASAA